MGSEQSLDSQLAALRAAAKSLREQRPSWFEHIFHPGRHARRQEDFSAAVVETLKEVIASIRNSAAKFAEEEREIAQLSEHQRESAATIQDLADRAAEMRQQFSQLAHEYSEKITQVVANHGDLGNEVRELIQHVLDEQRVAIRQLSLKASEDAILSDRARRATELKLEELVKRVPPSRK
jgi:methyl-accepting chemotaxis protein